MVHDPVSGPIPRERLAALADAPHGAAAKAIRSHDPFWGRITGDPIKWTVTVSREVTEYGRAYVEAASQEEADDLAHALRDREVIWGEDFQTPDGFDIESVEPKR